MYVLTFIILTICCSGVFLYELPLKPYIQPVYNVHIPQFTPPGLIIHGPNKAHNHNYNYQYSNSGNFGYNYGLYGNNGEFSYSGHHGNSGYQGNNGHGNNGHGNNGHGNNGHGNNGHGNNGHGNNGHGNNGHGNNGHGNKGGHGGHGNKGGYGHGHQHKPGCGHNIHSSTSPYFPYGGGYDFEDYDDTTIKPVSKGTTIKPNILSVKPPVTQAPSKPTKNPEVTTLPEETTDPFSIDIRFGNQNKTVTKRSTKETEQPTKASYTDNSLYPFGFWSFPSYYSESPNRLATCIHKKYDCIPQNKCKTASNAANNQRYCKFVGDVPYVCCEKQQTSRLSQKYDSICGRKKLNEKSAAIIGGANVANGNSYPWMVAIGQIDIDGNVEWFCGGALVSSQTVVTAAHCVGRRSPDIIRIGELDLTKSESSTMQEVYVWRKFVHPSYRPPTMYSDIALVYLDEPVKFNQFVRPVCLPQKTIGMAVGLLTGWGVLSFDGDKSPVLQEVTVQVFNNTLCDRYYSVGTAAKRNFPRGILDTQMCAGDEQGGKDACQGDSGSPLVVEEDGSYVLSGIVSAGIGCGSKSFPGIYTRVSSFVPWILENMI